MLKEFKSVAALKGLLKFVDTPDIIICDLVFLTRDFLISLGGPGRTKLMLLLHENEVDTKKISLALRCGVCGFLSASETAFDEAVLWNPGDRNLNPSIIRIFLDSIQIDVASPLSHRELDILDRIHNGYAIPEISQELAISPFTTRTHIKNIYKKLNVSSRMEAIRFAKSQRYL